MTEERKHAILLATMILTARKLQPLLEEDDKAGKPNMALDFWAEVYTKKSMERAAHILDLIDEKWPPNPLDCIAMSKTQLGLIRSWPRGPTISVAVGTIICDPSNEGSASCLLSELRLQEIGAFQLALKDRTRLIGGVGEPLRD